MLGGSSPHIHGNNGGECHEKSREALFKVASACKKNRDTRAFHRETWRKHKHTHRPRIPLFTHYLSTHFLLPERSRAGLTQVLLV